MLTRRRFVMILLLPLALMVPYGTGIGLAQIVSDAIVVDGRRINMQKLTIQCPFYHPEGEKVWNLHRRKYTLHLIDTRALADARGEALRPAENGYYAWSDNTWNTFITSENTFWLEPLTDVGFYIGTIPGLCYSSSCRNRYNGNVSVSMRRGISRNTLEMIIEYKLSCQLGDDAPTRSGCGEHITDKWDPPKDKFPCNILPYEAPPQRLGF